MGIPVTRFTMGSPTGMTNTCVCMQVFSNNTFFQYGNAALFFINPQITLTVQKCYSGTVISPVFQSF